MKITIKKSDFDRILEFSLSRRPEEACGLIAGRESEGGSRDIS